MRKRPLLATVLPLLLLLCAAAVPAAADSAEAQIRFGVDMAKRGLWSEALFRFQQAERLDPQSYRVWNNLAVAYEATGQFDQALDAYQRALRIEPSNRELRRNYARFIEFYQSYKPEAAVAADETAGASGDGATGGGEPAGEAPAAAAPPRAEAPPETAPVAGGEPG